VRNLTIGTGETATKNWTFTLGADWRPENCRIIAFFQMADEEIAQGAEVGLL